MSAGERAALDAWLEEPRTGAETRAEAARRLGDLASRLTGDDRLLVAFASGMLSGPQPEPEAGEVERLARILREVAADCGCGCSDCESGVPCPDGRAENERADALYAAARVLAALRARSEGAGWRPIETALRAEVDRATVEAGTRGDMRWSVGYVAGLNYARNLLRPLPAPPVTTEVDDGDDPSITHDLLLLLDIERITLEQVAAWTPEQRREVDEWASAIHLRASDNDDVEVPPMPDFLPPDLLDLPTPGAEGGDDGD